MQEILYQKTLAMTLASVLFFTVSAMANGDVALTLARQLYDEGDWHHAHAEAIRAQQEGSTNMPLREAIEHLSALRQQPSQAEPLHALQNWCVAHPAHPMRDWVMTEKNAITNASESTRQTVTGWLARGVIRFYQTQIGPALGQRCSMHPSCSRYSLEACRQYGLAGIPMTADRIIRESDHIRYRINPMIYNGREHYYDPVSNHSHWFRRYRQ